MNRHANLHGHVVVPLRPGEGLLRRASLAIRYLERHARRGTILLLSEGAFAPLERAARQLSVLLSPARGPDRSALAVRTVPVSALGSEFARLSERDLVLVPERGGGLEELARDRRCPHMVLDPT